MRQTVFVSMLALLISTGTVAGPESTIPDDVAKFIERRDLCDHFRGEEPYDKERRQFLENNMLEFCTGTDKELANLKQKYRKDEGILNKLNSFEEKIEASSFDK